MLQEKNEKSFLKFCIFEVIATKKTPILWFLSLLEYLRIEGLSTHYAVHNLVAEDFELQSIPGTVQVILQLSNLAINVSFFPVYSSQLIGCFLRYSRKDRRNISVKQSNNSYFIVLFKKRWKH